MLNKQQYEKINSELTNRCKAAKLIQENNDIDKSYDAGVVCGIVNTLSILGIKVYSESVTECYQIDPSFVDEDE